MNERQDRGRDRGFEEFAGAAQELFGWAAAIRGALTVGDVLGPGPALTELPPEQRLLWDRLAATLIPGTAATEPVLAIQLAQLLGAVDPDELGTYLRRIDINNPLTLQAIAEERELTRERIRQIQSGVQSELRASLEGEEFNLLRWTIAEIDARLRSHLPVAELGQIPELKAIEDALLIAPAVTEKTELAPGIPPCRGLARGLALDLAGGFRVAGGWVSRGSGGTPARSAQPMLETVREHGSVNLAQAVRRLADRGFGAPAARYFIDSNPDLQVMDGLVFWWKGDIAMKAAAMLRRIGRPATANELLELLGGSRTVRTMRNALYKNPEIVRVSKTEFALKEWDPHEYGGISDEIERLVGIGGGSAQLSELVSEISGRFKVAEQSVIQYALAPRFVNQQGVIRVRTPDEPFMIQSPQPLREAGAFAHSDGVWVHVVHVNHETLRGSGRVFSTHLAWELGVRPGLGVNFDLGAGLEIPISWPVQSFTAHIGSLREIANEHGAQAGDRLLLQLDGPNRTANVALVRAGDAPAQVLDALTEGMSGSYRSRLAKLIETSENGVEEQLESRGDAWLADALRALRRQ